MNPRVPRVQVITAAREPLSLSHLESLGLVHLLKSLPGWGLLFYEREYRCVHIATLTNPKLQTLGPTVLRAGV